MATRPRWHLMCGYAGSGKSAVARMLAHDRTVVLNRDDLMIRAVGSAYESPEYAAKLGEVTEYLWGLARQISATGASVVLDWNHWSQQRRAESAERARAAGAEPVVQWVRVPVEEAVRLSAGVDRAFGRKAHMLTAEAIRHSATIFEEPSHDEGLVIFITASSEDPDVVVPRLSSSVSAPGLTFERFLQALDQVGEPVAAPIALGRVKWVSSEGGWGSLESDDTPGDAFFHFSMLDGPRQVAVGQMVEFAFEDFSQDGCAWRALWVRPL